MPSGLIPRAPEEPAGDFPLRVRRALQQITDLLNSLILQGVLVQVPGAPGQGSVWTINVQVLLRGGFMMPGIPGDDGEQGLRGAPGTAGATGATGAAGANGPPGMPGEDGEGYTFVPPHGLSGHFS